VALVSLQNVSDFVYKHIGQQNGCAAVDIWLQSTSGGEPRRLASHPSNDYEPDISPDNSEVVFRSDRHGGGIYSVSALGGDPRLIVKDGYVPHFSPGALFNALKFRTAARALHLNRGHSSIGQKLHVSEK
jgi:hypothetical protein